MILWMSLLIVTAIPFVHRAWMTAGPARTLDQIKNQQTMLAILNFICLFAGAFSFNLKFTVAMQALFFASVISFALLYQNPEPAKRASPQASFRASSVQLVFLMTTLAICLWKPWMVLVIPFFLPWILPQMIRLQFDCTPMKSSTLKASIFYVFQKEKINLNEIYILNHPRLDYQNAFTCGRSLFISLKLFETLTLDELCAVILHEGAHLKLHHFTKRIWASIGFLVLATLWIVPPAVALFTVHPWMMGATGVLIIMTQFFLLGRVIYRQEFEADLLSIELGSSSDALISALKKTSAPLETPSIFKRLLTGNYHPTLDERISVISEHTIPSHARVIPNLSYFTAYSMLSLGFFLWMANDISRSSVKVSHVENRSSER